MNRFFAITFFFLFGLSLIKAQSIKPRYHGFPKPGPIKHMLFYLQRTIDYNTVIYELNFEKSGKLSTKEPIKMYWIDFEDGGKISLLTYAQQKFAYGIEARERKSQKGEFEIKLVAYKKLVFRLAATGIDQTYELRTNIRGRELILRKVFVNIVGGTLLKPIVKDIVLTATDVLNGHEVEEIVIP